MRAEDTVHPIGKRRIRKPSSATWMLGWIAFAILLGMSPWFAGTAIAADLARELSLDAGAAAWLTVAVQLGFVVGTLASAAVNLPDVVPARQVFAFGCLAAALATASAIAVTSPAMLIAGRFVTGVALAGVYPPAMKIAAAWTVARRGTALGLLIGALTLGKAVPHLLVWVSAPLAWRSVLALVSVQAVCAGAIMLLVVRDGPYLTARSRFDPRAALEVVRNPATRRATLGYLGHMWELYAFWTWIGVFAAASAAAVADVRSWGAFVAFAALAAGAPACLVAGLAADRVGKARVAQIAMWTSGACCLLSPWIFGAGPWVILLIALVWGAAVIADSAQFSALIAEYTEPTHVGTALTLQVAVGFLLTTVSIWSTQALASWAGWQWAFLPLAAGPLAGALVMAPRRFPISR